MKNTAFKHNVCDRCCGTGHYSYNPVNGTTCFKCGGRGFLLTKIGNEACKYYVALLSKPAHLLQAGERIRLDMGLSVTWVTFDHLEGDTLVAHKGTETYRYQLHDGELVRVSHDGESKTVKLKQALQYEAAIS